MSLLSIIIPVYKAKNCLHELYRRLVNVLEKENLSFEIIFVEDCGEDGSWDVIQQFAEQDKRIKGIQFTRNFGQHYAITAGLDHCDSDWVIIMDCDLQDRPEEIPRLLEKANEGYDVVTANRINRKTTFIKKIASRFFYRIFRYFLGLDYNGQAGNFCIISRKVVVNFRRMNEQLRFFGGLVHWMGFKSTTIDVQHDARFSGKSAYSYKKLWKLASNTIIAYSDKPLRLSVRLGFLMSFFSFVYGMIIFFHAFTHHSPVPGWTSLIVSLYFLGGMIIAILGIIGIYLGKTFDEAKKRPLYIIQEII